MDISTQSSGLEPAVLTLYSQVGCVVVKPTQHLAPFLKRSNERSVVIFSQPPRTALARPANPRATEISGEAEKPVW